MKKLSLHTLLISDMSELSKIIGQVEHAAAIDRSAKIGLYEFDDLLRSTRVNSRHKWL